MLVRGGVSLVVAGIIGQLWAAVPLYFAEALCVELAAPALARRPLPFGAVSGVLIGTAGFAAEYGWSHVVMRLPWNTDILPEGVIMSVAGGVAGGLLGALLVLGLWGRLPRPAVARSLFAGALVVIAASVTNGLLINVPHDVRVSVTLTDVRGDADHRTAGAHVTVSPAGALKDASWVTITAWQGSGLYVDRLTALGGGAYETTGRMPLYGPVEDPGPAAGRPVHQRRAHLPSRRSRDRRQAAARGRAVDPARAERAQGAATGAQAGCPGLAVDGLLRGRPGLHADPGHRARLGRRPRLPPADRHRGDPVVNAPLATHSAVTAIPFFLPTIVIVAVIVTVVWRDRRRHPSSDETPEGDSDEAE